MPSFTPDPPYTDPCIIHKPITFRGGGEDYAGTLAAELDAPIYTLKQTESLAQDVEVVEFGDDWRRHEQVLERVPFGDLLIDAAYSSFDVPTQHDAVITTGAAAKSVVHHPHQRRFHLLHAPRRWLFERRDSYEDAAAPVRWLKQLYRLGVQTVDTVSAARVDDFVVNSEVIGRRLETYYRREPTAVIYPPIETADYRHEPSDDYLLSLGRLEENKRVLDVVDALEPTDYRLKIAGTGSQEEAISQRAGPNVDVLGYVSDEEKRNLLANCEAVVFNAEHEDFGIVPVEAFASGKPVVGVAEGFTVHQIDPGTNGELFERDPEELRAAVDRVYDREWDPDRIQTIANQFDTETMAEQWRSLLTESG